jgi:hypothetical protein
MHPVLRNAIENPRFARPYGSDRGDYGFEMGGSGVDNYIKSNNIGMGNADEMVTKRSIASGRARAIGTHSLH